MQKITDFVLMNVDDFNFLSSIYTKIFTPIETDEVEILQAIKEFEDFLIDFKQRLP
jgi:hypothetical protein